MKYFSLFSGIGGFEYGILLSKYAHFCEEPKQEECPQMRLGVADVQRIQLLLGNNAPLCIGFSEIDKYATQIYKKHFPKHKEYGDVTKINWETVLI